MLLNRALFYLQLVLLFFAVSSDGKKKRRRKDQYADDPEVKAQNICNIAGPTIIYCYCDSQEVNEATEGNCWVFNDTSLKEYADIWEDFASQNAIKHFTLHLRTDGTVKRVPTIAFIHLRQIEHFEVQYATIDSIHSFAFANSSTLEEILLSRNAIKELQPSAFANHNKLSKILLGENHLTEIKRGVFENLPKLTHLHVEQNNITSIADHAFNSLGSLQELDLFSNQIKVIFPTTFIGLEKLQRLNLHRNRLEVIGDKTFQYLKSLTELQLDGNSIKFISPKGFYGITKLRKLNLKDNKLLSLGADLFKSTEMLNYLDLSQNVLETIEEDAFYPIKKMLLHEGMILMLKGNTLRCDTRLKWMFTVYNETQSRSVRDALDEIHCYLENGPLPQRFDPLPTPVYEVTTLGIGPRVKLMKLRPSELPDPLLKTPATYTEDCEEVQKPTHKTKTKKGHRGSKRKMKHKTHPSTTPTPIAEEKSMKKIQNDMASHSGKKKRQKVPPELRPAAPVQESMAYNNNNDIVSISSKSSISSLAFGTLIFLLRLV